LTISWHWSGVCPRGKNGTRDSLGTCVLALLSNPARWERARSGPQSVPLLFEENLRCAAPLRGVFRETTEQVELGGQILPQGTRLYVFCASGNRDETRFADPGTFNPATA
jgi:cytochrome P450